MGGRDPRRVVKQVAVAAAGLALGVGAIAVFGGNNGASYTPGTPSVSAFPFATTPPLGAPAAAVSSDPGPLTPPAGEPTDALGAVSAFLQPLADGRPELAYPLLDQAGRARFSTPAAWARAQVDRPQPLTFQVGASRPSPDVPGAIEVDVSATHRPSLDSIRGLVPARSQSVWLVRREGGAWRVAAEPLSFRPIVPADDGASGVVQTWVSRLAACDTAGAADLQVGPSLYGPAGLVQAPCQKKGTWTAGTPVGLDKTPDPKAFLAAFGPDVGTWARLVPVRGPGSSFLAAVAPMGDGWLVMGVAVDGQ
jgi:hypothetical protein